MAAKMTCRVCGKTYEACNTMLAPKRFAWKKVACSPECGQEYLRRIMISRGELPVDPAPAKKDIIDQEAAPAAKSVRKKAAAVKPESD